MISRNPVFVLISLSIFMLIKLLEMVDFAALNKIGHGSFSKSVLRLYLGIHDSFKSIEIFVIRLVHLTFTSIIWVILECLGEATSVIFVEGNDLIQWSRRRDSRSWLAKQVTLSHRVSWSRNIILVHHSGLTINSISRFLVAKFCAWLVDILIILSHALAIFRNIIYNNLRGSDHGVG